MSDNNPEVPAEETPAAEALAAEPPKARGTVAPPSMLSRPTDAAARPGFRSPPNNKSKAQKKRK